MKFIGKLLYVLIALLQWRSSAFIFYCKTRWGRARQRLGFTEQQLPSGL